MHTLVKRDKRICELVCLYTYRMHSCMHVCYRELAGWLCNNIPPPPRRSCLLLEKRESQHNNNNNNNNCWDSWTGNTLCCWRMRLLSALTETMAVSWLLALQDCQKLCVCERERARSATAIASQPASQPAIAKYRHTHTHTHTRTHTYA